MTSGVGLAGFSTRVRYLRVLNSIPFDFIVPAVTTGPTFAFRRATMVPRGEATANCLLSEFPAIFFTAPRASSGCPAVAHSGCPGYSGTIYPSRPESLVSNRDPPNKRRTSTKPQAPPLVDGTFLFGSPHKTR